ncbi:hypothetical protein [Clostridium sp. L2-50]|jgi:hypothetical protein|uniref:hypothetical protein n=1 Tax=Clostridium sp. L2-50 TaxID=411489 RepID=UPI00015BD726|nr:hypothetical protein [Clostridium sp. L2-50]EDO56996.1 hypothetical protein CLOL250_02182 [Clostridium sp. L2-50]UEA74948.1 hypothetical protein LK416_01840 [Lachnospiraceae bacterium GAM79]UEA78141.1 hypothetical protein LK424_05185 [Lachnospiraceae bacterium GAM79]
MDNELVYSADATYQKVQYDASAKRLLGQKIILAHILIRVVDEFKGMDAETVASLIEGEPYISQVPVEPGLTNKEMVDAGTGERIVGLNTESSEIDEGKVYFDIIFYVRMRDGLAKMIINLEASQTMTAEQKLKLIKQEYDIPVDRHSIREEVKIMCNLSEGVEEMGCVKGEAAGMIAGRAEGEKIGEARGKAIGRSEGRLEGKSEERADIILKMHKKGYSLEQIMDVTEMSEAEIKAIIE